MKHKFLPCPFCGGNDIRHTAHSDNRSPTGLIFSMCCYRCGATFPNRYKLELLMSAWNTRADIETTPIKKIVHSMEKSLSAMIYQHNIPFYKAITEARNRTIKRFTK
jgi:Lar family restriction alleviation protein